MELSVQEKRARVARAIELYADTVRRICFIYLKSPHDVEDIFQEVFLQLLRHEKGFSSDEHEKAWLIKVAVNKCKDFHKSFFQTRVSPLDDLEIPFEDDTQHDLIQTLLTLPQKYRNVLYLFYYEGYTVPEITQLVGARENTVYSWLHRARRMLKERLGTDYGKGV
jgi:RNA polymerase sigma-70 factor (ECF subfamily)